MDGQNGTNWVRLHALWFASHRHTRRCCVVFVGAFPCPHPWRSIIRRGRSHESSAAGSIHSLRANAVADVVDAEIGTMLTCRQWATPSCMQTACIAFACSRKVCEILCEWWLCMWESYVYFQVMVNVILRLFIKNIF